MAHVTGGGELADYLLIRFPSSAPRVQDALDVMDGEADLATYSLLSVAFWWATFEPALRSNDQQVLRECFDALEDFLASPDQELVMAVRIRVVEYLESDEWRPHVEQFAGVELRTDWLRTFDAPL